MKPIALALLVALGAASAAFAEESSELMHGTVVSVVDARTESIPGTDRSALIQDLTVRLDSGEEIQVYNDRITFGAGDRLYVQRVEFADGPVYSVHDADRRGMLMFAVVLFSLATIAVGRMVGVRALVSLALSIILILYGLVPLLASGFPPVLVSLMGAACILAVAMAVTHGVTRMTVAAFAGALIAVVVAIGLGEFFVYAAHLSGFADDAAALVTFTVGVDLNMQGLLLGALIIGVLGIVDDLAVTQVATVAEIRSTGITDPKELYARAMRVGREHLGAVVNTLVLAYAGASLPLLILFSYSPAPTWFLINSEVLAVEIIRAAVGGVALAAVIPVATYLGILANVAAGEESSGHLHSH